MADIPFLRGLVVASHSAKQEAQFQAQRKSRQTPTPAGFCV